jgi:hypothetical protein
LPILFNREAVLGFRKLDNSPPRIDFILLDEVQTIRGLRVNFSAELSSESDPNKTTIKVYNLSREKRTFLESISGDSSTMKALVELNVGYSAYPTDDREIPLETLVSGDVKLATTKHEGPDVITKIEIGEQEWVYRRARINKSYKPNTTYRQIINDLLLSMGLKGQNLDVIPHKVFNTGKPCTGLSRDCMNELTDTLDLNWTAQQGRVVFSKIDLPIFDLVDVPILRSGVRNENRDEEPNTGLIGAPMITDKGIKFKTLLNAAILPKTAVNIVSRVVDGNYLVTKVKHTGDTFGQNWYTEGEATQIL